MPNPSTDNNNNVNPDKSKTYMDYCVPSLVIDLTGHDDDPIVPIFRTDTHSHSGQITEYGSNTTYSYISENTEALSVMEAGSGTVNVKLEPNVPTQCKTNEFLAHEGERTLASRKTAMINSSREIGMSTSKSKSCLEMKISQLYVKVKQSNSIQVLQDNAIGAPLNVFHGGDSKDGGRHNINVTNSPTTDKQKRKRKCEEPRSRYNSKTSNDVQVNLKKGCKKCILPRKESPCNVTLTPNMCMSCHGNGQRCTGTMHGNKRGISNNNPETMNNGNDLGLSDYRQTSSSNNTGFVRNKSQPDTKVTDNGQSGSTSNVNRSYELIHRARLANQASGLRHCCQIYKYKCCTSSKTCDFSALGHPYSYRTRNIPQAVRSNNGVDTSWINMGYDNPGFNINKTQRLVNCGPRAVSIGQCTARCSPSLATNNYMCQVNGNYCTSGNQDSPTCDGCSHCPPKNMYPEHLLGTPPSYTNQCLKVNTPPRSTYQSSSYDALAINANIRNLQPQMPNCTQMPMTKTCNYYTRPIAAEGTHGNQYYSNIDSNCNNYNLPPCYNNTNAYVSYPNVPYSGKGNSGYRMLSPPSSVSLPDERYHGNVNGDTPPLVNNSMGGSGHTILSVPLPESKSTYRGESFYSPIVNGADGSIHASPDERCHGNVNGGTPPFVNSHAAPGVHIPESRSRYNDEGVSPLIVNSGDRSIHTSPSDRPPGPRSPYSDAGVNSQGFRSHTTQSVPLADSRSINSSEDGNPPSVNSLGGSSPGSTHYLTLLKRLFPQYTDDALQYVLEGCNGDIIKSIDSILECQAYRECVLKACRNLSSYCNTQNMKSTSNPQKPGTTQASAAAPCAESMENET